MTIDWTQIFQTSTLADVFSFLPHAAAALTVLVVGWIAFKWARAVTRKALGRSGIDPILVPFLTGLVYVSLIVFVAIAALGVLGIPVATFVAVLGAAGLAIALAFQGTLSNFASGVMLLTFRPFDVGDFVEVGGVSGTVKGVGIFSCILATPDNVQISVPNSGVFGHTIKNYSANETRRVDLVVGVGYGDDLALAVRTCRDVLAADRRVLADPEPFVAVAELADSSVNLVVRPWVKREDHWRTKCDLTATLKVRLEAAGCTLPYPTQDVHLHQVA